MYFQDFKTTRQNEAYKRCSVIYEEMQNEQPANQKDVYMQRDSIIIGEATYEKQVTPPKTSALLSLPMHQLNNIMAIRPEARGKDRD